jgi:hypothetical protein
MKRKEFAGIIAFLAIAVIVLSYAGYISQPTSSQKGFMVASKLGEAEIIIANGTWTAIYYKVNSYVIFQDSNYNTVVEWAMNQTRNPLP